MATVKKYQKSGPPLKKSTPTYKNLRMGVKNENYLMSGENKDIKPSSKDSARYRGGFEQGLKGMKGMPNEGQVEKMGRWEGQNVGKKSGVVKKAKKGMKVKKAQDGVKQEWYNPRDKDSTTRRTVVADTSGYSTGAKSFPTKTTISKGTFSGTASRKQVDKMIKNPRMGAFGVTPKGKTGAKMTKKCAYGCK
jgi:hypothetical protein